jgi:hypothetical protein
MNLFLTYAHLIINEKNLKADKVIFFNKNSGFETYLEVYSP